MQMLTNYDSKRVFDYFLEICEIPHGSGDMEKISNYCVEFAKAHKLRYIKDAANNVSIFKPATKGYENAAPVILQGHMDMVCQKTPDSNFDFLRDSLKVYTDGDFIKAEGTTLGADNGIALAMVLAILENDEIAHPEIQAVFTTDEEIGMLGAGALDMSNLTAKRMINLDSEEDGVVTVSCAGGVDFKMSIPFSLEEMTGTAVTVVLAGLLGGHSGVDINKNRYNADMLAGRLLYRLSNRFDFGIISVNGGDKTNAIVNRCEIKLCCDDADSLVSAVNLYVSELKEEIKSAEPNFNAQFIKGDSGEFEVLDEKSAKSLILTLNCVPNGVLNMSADIENLVETSLNLGILKTNDSDISMQFALRSNNKSALNALADKLECFAKGVNANYETSGFYPPWEYRTDSPLRDTYTEVYKQIFDEEPKAEAIHAGLECAVFASKIQGIDCIAMGPALFDVHTVNERASISSIERTFKLLLEILKKCK
ncbi:MAG: aminoacyl-histidine dipeptidase [Clostridia bacterium]|nr:aminoacyl-histidine dipeptidase [Clostridia bacterium]